MFEVYKVIRNQYHVIIDVRLILLGKATILNFDTQVPDSKLCSDGNGTFACGVCYCNPGRYGKVCECDLESGSGKETENCRE